MSASSPQYAHACQWTAFPGNDEWSGAATSGPSSFRTVQNAPDTASNARSDDRLCDTVGASVVSRIASNPRMLPIFLRSRADMTLAESCTSRRVAEIMACVPDRPRWVISRLEHTQREEFRACSDQCRMFVCARRDRPLRGAGAAGAGVSWRRLGPDRLVDAWWDDAQVPLPHRRDVCRCGGGLGVHVTRKARVGHGPQTLSMRQRRGVTPVSRVNVLVKWLWSAKPHASETICSGMDDVRMYIIARSMR